jgi:hypothetical protein
MNTKKTVGMIALLVIVVFISLGGSECGKKDKDPIIIGSSKYESPPPSTSSPWSITSNPSTGTDIANAVAMDDNYLYIVGHDYTSSGYSYDCQWRTEKRLKTTAALDTAFDSDGVIISKPSDNIDSITAVSVDDSYLYLVGYSLEDAILGFRWRIEKRNKTTAALVTGFDSDGVVISTPRTREIPSVALITDVDYLYIIGNTDNISSTQWQMEKRYKTTGVLVTAFGLNGVITSNPSTFFDTPYAITADNNYLYLVGSAGYALNDTQWQIEKCDKTTGVLVTNFGSNGVITSNPSASFDTPYAVTADANYIYIVGYDSTPGNKQWRIEKRDKATGGLVAAFDSDGIIAFNSSTGDDVINAVTADNNYLYIVGYDSTPGNKQWRIEKRDKTTGGLVVAFDSDGIIAFNPSTGDDVINAVTADNNYLYIVGYDSTPGNGQWRIEKRDKTTGGQ